MKKILAFLLAATLLCAMFVIPSNAKSTNHQIDIPFNDVAPTIDGKVNAGEYKNALPFHSFDKADDQFITTLDQYGDWGYDFYVCWDKENLYMAWVVNTAIHEVVTGDIATAGSKKPDGVIDSNDYAWMWEKCCVQFILTTGAPDKSKKVYQTGQWSGDYLEVGLMLKEDGGSYKVAWSKPTGGEGLTTEDWNASITRDDAKKQTTYEVQIPWVKSGVKTVGNNQQFGLTYAVAAQEDYNTKQGMIEWQDAILGGKNADAAAIVTMSGAPDNQVSSISMDAPKPLEAGTLPSEYDAAKSIALTLDKADVAISAESSSIFTDASKLKGNNLNWAFVMLLEPVEGKDNWYTFVEGVTGDGSEDSIKFNAEIKDGMIAAAFHSDGAEGSTGMARKTAAAALAAGTELYLFGVDLDEGKLLYNNAMLFTADGKVDEGDTSSAESSEASSEAPSADASSEAPSAAASSTAPTSSQTDAGEDEGGIPVWVWIVIAVVVIGGGAAAFIIIRKKKA